MPTAILILIALHVGALQTSQAMKLMTNEQLVVAMQTKDPEKAYAAAREVFARGESMFPLLLALKGTKRPFAGAGCLSPPTSSGQLVELSSGEETSERGVSMEVAALFLITAIYRGNLQFAQSPFLSDLALPPGERQSRNTQALIKRAWRSTEAWAKLLKNEEITQLRKQKRDPLQGSRVAFW